MDFERQIKRKKLFLDNNKMNSITNELLKEYKIEGIIAQGTFGKVTFGIHKKTNEKVC